MIAPSSFLDQKAANFNGTDEYAHIDDPTFKADTAGAFAFWYRPASVLVSAGVKRILSYGVKNAGNNAQLQFFQRHNSSTNIQLSYRSAPIPDIQSRATHNGTFNTVYGKHVFTADTLVHLVFQSNGSAYSLYVNGTSIDASAWGGSNNGDWFGDIGSGDVNGHRLAFGAVFNANAITDYGDGKLNEICYISGRGLTSGEITALCYGGSPANPRKVIGSDLKLWLRGGDSRDDASKMYDESGNGNDATLVNMDASNYQTP